MGPLIRYAILGPIGLSDGERLQPAGGPRQVALLAFLLVHANRAVSSDRLIDTLWGRQSPASALQNLHVTISRLRKMLGADGAGEEPVLRTVAGGYLLAVRPGELDAEVFQTRVEEGRRALEAGEAAWARQELREALEMWRGAALAEVAYEEFAQRDIRRLDELRLAAIEAHVDAELRLGEHSAAIVELESLVVAHPGRERLAAQLMLALYRCGRQGDALEVYTRTRAYLAGELGLEPGPALQALQADILAQSPALQHVADTARSAACDRPRVEPAEPIMLRLPRSLRVGADSPFVGREAELARLHESWEQERGSARLAVLIGGEPGIGKTRLASEFAKDVHEQGALVLYGRCDEDLAVPYQPFVEALRPYARAAGVSRLYAELGDLAPELGRLLPECVGPGRPVRGDPQSARFALFEAVAALVEAMARGRRMLLVLDDLHWAAAPTLVLLRHLIRCDCALGGLVLCTYRDSELDAGQPLAQLFADLYRDSTVERLDVRGLDEPAIATLVETTAGRALDGRASELARVLEAQTSGNPFFIRELLAHLGEHLSEGLTAAQLEVPEGLRQVIGQRVARLSAATGRVLRVAAVAGPTFSFVLLERVLDEPAGVLDGLDEAVAAGLLTEIGNGDYAFAHALVRQTIYGELSAARRMRLHRQVGEALEASGDIDAHVEALAYHFAQAAADGQAMKAADYALAAGRSATARLGYEEAAAHYERGLNVLTRSAQAHDRRRCELLLALGEARWGAAEVEKARNAYMQSAELAQKLGDGVALAHAALGFCGPHRGEVAAGVTLPVADVLQRAFAALGDEDSELRAQLMGRMAAYTGWRQRRPELARQALAMARRVGDNATLADVLASAHGAIRGPDTLLECLAMAGELGHVADEIGDPQLRAMAHWRVLDALLELGDIEAVERELEALQRLADGRRERFFKWILTVLRANRALLHGQLEDGEMLAHEALAYRYEGHDEPATHVFGVQTFFIRRAQGRLDELLDRVKLLAEQYPEPPNWRCGLALTYALLERPVQARQELEALAREDFRDVPRDASWLMNLVALSEVVVFLGDAPRAQLLYELLLPFADRCLVMFALLGSGSVSRRLGGLATTMSRFEDAERHFEHALTTNARIRAPILIAGTQHDYAGMLLRRNRPGDGATAFKLLDDVISTAEELGLKALADQALALKLAAEAAVPASESPRPV
jgi:DNA-binding SARP family transcriptional activator